MVTFVPLSLLLLVNMLFGFCSRRLCAWFGPPSLLVLVLLAGCGGGGSTATTPPTTPNPTSAISSVSASCSPTTVGSSATAQCVASVQGTGNYSSAVTWSASAGSVNAAGAFTAPGSATSVTVTATSTQDTTKSGSATITVQAPAPSPSITSVSVICTPTTVTAGSGTAQCAATVQGTGSYSSAVTWSAASGAISPSGLLTAPASAGNVVVTATSTEDATKSGSATITVQAPAPPPPTITSVSVTCNPTTVNAASGTSQCAATVQGTEGYSSAVTWSASDGSISASGLFTAPETAETVTITATSAEDTSQSASATVNVQLHTPASQHIVIVMEENQSYSSVVGKTSAWPNLNKLIASGALPTSYYADSHPSIGDYLMLTTGQLLTTNDSSRTVWNVDNIARRMLVAGIPFRVYAEGITQGYCGGNTGLYVIRHNPFALLSDVCGNPTVAKQVIWPYTQFATDLANNALPEFSFVVPNVDDDAHNGTPQQADSWLEKNVVVRLSNNAAFQAGGDGILAVLFDESVTSDTTNGGGHVADVLWGPDVKVGYTQASTTLYQHQSMLRTVMEALGLANPPGAAANAPSMAEFFVQK